MNAFFVLLVFKMSITTTDLNRCPNWAAGHGCILITPDHLNGLHATGSLIDYPDTTLVLETRTDLKLNWLATLNQHFFLYTLIWVIWKVLWYLTLVSNFSSEAIAIT